MHIKTTMRYHLTPVRMAIINNQQTTHAGKDSEKKEPSCPASGNADRCSHCKKKKKNYEKEMVFLPNDSSFRNPTNHETPIQKNICTPTFLAVLFIIAKIWKQPKCLSVDEWIKKLWYIYTMEYYSAIKKKEILPFVTAWMDLENIMLSEISQSEKDKYHMVSLICRI